MSWWKAEKLQPGQETTQLCHSLVELELLVMQVHLFVQSHAVTQQNKHAVCIFCRNKRVAYLRRAAMTAKMIKEIGRSQPLYNVLWPCK